MLTLSRCLLNDIYASKKSFNTYGAEPDSNLPTLLMVLKPELQALPQYVWLSVIRLIFDKLNMYAQVHRVAQLSGSFVRSTKFIEKNWLLLNTLSNCGSKIICEDAIHFNGVHFKPGELLIGGHELLRARGLAIDQLEGLIRSGMTFKLGAGFYLTSIIVFGEHFSVINGFHPMQEHCFGLNTAKMIAVEISPKISLSEFRANVVGNMIPNECSSSTLKGSIHSLLLENGLDGLSLAKNGFHCSPNWLDASLGIESVWGMRPNQPHIQFPIDPMQIGHHKIWDELEDEDWPAAKEILDRFVSSIRPSYPHLALQARNW